MWMPDVSAQFSLLTLSMGNKTFCHHHKGNRWVDLLIMSQQIHSRSLKCFSPDFFTFFPPAMASRLVCFKAAPWTFGGGIDGAKPCFLSKQVPMSFVQLDVLRLVCLICRLCPLCPRSSRTPTPACWSQNRFGGLVIFHGCQTWHGSPYETWTSWNRRQFEIDSMLKMHSCCNLAKNHVVLGALQLHNAGKATNHGSTKSSKTFLQNQRSCWCIEVGPSVVGFWDH